VPVAQTPSKKESRRLFILVPYALPMSGNTSGDVVAIVIARALVSNTSVVACCLACAIATQLKLTHSTSAFYSVRGKISVISPEEVWESFTPKAML